VTFLSLYSSGFFLDIDKDVSNASDSFMGKVFQLKNNHTFEN